MWSQGQGHLRSNCTWSGKRNFPVLWSFFVHLFLNIIWWKWVLYYAMGRMHHGKAYFMTVPITDIELWVILSRDMQTWRGQFLVWTLFYHAMIFNYDKLLLVLYLYRHSCYRQCFSRSSEFRVKVITRSNWHFLRKNVFLPGFEDMSSRLHDICSGKLDSSLNLWILATKAIFMIINVIVMKLWGSFEHF